MVRKIVEVVPDEVLQQDLEKYRQRAIELGAMDAKVITADMVLIDQRVRAKCIFPTCRRYGTNVNCPPHAMDLDQVREMVNNFHYAIFTKIEVPSELITGPHVRIITGPRAREKRLWARYQIKNHEIVSKLEAEAFYDSYYLAVGFADGSCKIAFCPNLECSALVPGQGCRQPLRARPSMEGVGMNAFLMAAKVGWDVYPIGPSANPTEVPHGTMLGLVLIY